MDNVINLDEYRDARESILFHEGFKRDLFMATPKAHCPGCKEQRRLTGSGKCLACVRAVRTFDHYPSGEAA